MRSILFYIVIIILSVFCANAQDTFPAKATYYANKFNGRRAADGSIYLHSKPTAASNKYPLGTRLLVINKKTGKSIVVTVTDRMAAYVKHNRIDLSQYTFKTLAPLAQGVQDVLIVEML